MITVHHLNNSRSQRVLWLLEELGLEYELKFYKRDSVTMLAPKELRAVHPLGKSPIITDGNVTVAESGAIIEYILDTYGNGRLRPPSGSAGRSFFRCDIQIRDSVSSGWLLRLTGEMAREIRMNRFCTFASIGPL